MTSARMALLAAITASLVLAGCSSSTSASPAASGPASVAATAAPSAAATPEEIDLGALAASQAASAAPSGSVDPLTQWCNTYAFLSKTIAEAGTSKDANDTALRALTRFRELWVLAGNAELITQEETDANLRAVDAYTEVVKVIAAGGTENSPEYTAAKKNVTTTTETDHALLQSSAGKILGYCGAPSASPAPSGS